MSQKNIVTWTAMLTLYAQNGQIGNARKLFDEMPKRTPASYNAMILLHSQWLTLFDRMLVRNVVSWSAMIDRYIEKGLFENGFCLFLDMRREGVVEDAREGFDFLDGHDQGILGPLLAASKAHLRLDLAKLAAQRINELEPANGTTCVVLSNMYSTAGQKIEGDLVRKTKNSKGIKKSPGSSWITIKDEVHLFLAGDQLHRNIEEIKAIILTIDKGMQWLYYCEQQGSVSMRDS
ncbi:unnamed protein product [Trifolium pratense]|uniref:Uncharacterized protein n=1 Tax=Trifolium pratense TaxID=57577 RepID=A0ACB0KSS5_TRIPR|nr:unnamed protein product [Trifolium pratense]